MLSGELGTEPPKALLACAACSGAEKSSVESPAPVRQQGTAAQLISPPSQLDVRTCAQCQRGHSFFGCARCCGIGMPQSLPQVSQPYNELDTKITGII